MTAAELFKLLRVRFPADAYAMMREVGDGTGSNCRRHLDALAMSLWPSRGLELLGFELKVSRSDWKRELDNPAKAANHIRYLHRFYLVVADKKIVQPGELPAAWGLIAPDTKGLRIVTEAPKLDPEPVSLAFLAALMRKAQSIGPEEIASAKREALAEQAAQLISLQNENARLKRIAEQPRYKELAAFEEAAGISLSSTGYSWSGGYKPEEAGAMLRTLLDGQALTKLQHMKWLEKSLRKQADDLRDLLAKAPMKVQP